MSRLFDTYFTRNVLTFVNTTTIACHQNPEALANSLPVCNSSCIHKRQDITSRDVRDTELLGK